MPLPSYVPVRSVSVGGATVLESAALLRVQVTVTASRPLVWSATGYRFENVGTQSTSEPGSEVVLTLPRTDVQGWRDGRSGAILDVSAEGAYSHRYIAQVRYLDEAGRSIGVPFTIGPFVLPEGDGVLDLDTTVPASTVAGDAVSVPDSWGADVLAARAAAEAAEAALASIGTPAVAPTSDTIPKRTAAGTLKVAGATEGDDAVPLRLVHIGPSNGVDDTERIQGLLNDAREAGGGALLGAPGETYLISSALVIGSNTKILAEQSNFTMLPGTNDHFLTNYSDQNPVGEADDATITIGTNIVTTSLAAVATVGDTVYIDGAGSNGHGELVANVIAVGSGALTLGRLNIVDAAATAQATVAGAHIQLSHRDKNIVALLGTMNRGANGPSGAATGIRGERVKGHSIFLRGVDYYHVEVRKALSTEGISFIWPTNAAHGIVRLYDCRVKRTGVQVVGPIYDLTLYCAGNCNDDLVNLCGNVYPDQCNTSGDVIGVTIEDIVSRGLTYGSALKLNAGQGNLVDAVTVEGRIGMSSPGQGFPVWIGTDDEYPATSGGQYGTIDLGMIDVERASGAALWLRRADAHSVRAKIKASTIHPVRIEGTTDHRIESLDLDVDLKGNVGDGIRFDSVGTVGTLALRIRNFTPTAGSAHALTVRNTGTIKHLIVSESEIRPGRLVDAIIDIQGGTVEKFTMRDNHVEHFSAANGQVLIRVAGGTINDLAVEGGLYELGDAIIRANSGILGDVTFGGGVRQRGGQRFLHTALPANVFIGGVRRDNCSQTALYPQSSTVALAVRGWGFVATGANNRLIEANAAASTVDGHTLGVDISLINLSVGAVVRNTNASLPQGVGPVVCDGAAWRSLREGGAVKTGFVSLVAGTATVADAAITATSIIRLAQRQTSGTPGAVFVSARTVGTGFTISSTSPTDTSSIRYDIVTY